MVDTKGGFSTAVKLLNPSQPAPTGYIKLLQANRLDLSMEHLIIQKPWNALFTAEQLKVARQRLG